MAAAQQSFAEVLNGEVSVDMVKLADMAQHGIPQRIRGEVWQYLLGVRKPEKSQDMENTRTRHVQYQELLASEMDGRAALLKKELHTLLRKRLLPRLAHLDLFKQEQTHRKITNVLATYLQHTAAHQTRSFRPWSGLTGARMEQHSDGSGGGGGGGGGGSSGNLMTPTDEQWYGGVSISPVALISLVAPLVYCIPAESDVFWSFESLMKRKERFVVSVILAHQSSSAAAAASAGTSAATRSATLALEHDASSRLGELLGTFMMLFRAVSPELFTHFEEEELNPTEWATSWLYDSLLSRELPLECVLRLWDTYFSIPDGLDLHIYVCLAILVSCFDDLVELDATELKIFLNNLPAVDVDEIIAQAYHIRNFF